MNVVVIITQKQVKYWIIIIVNSDTLLCKLPKNYIYNLSKRQQHEEELEITINRCFVEKVGILK